MHRIFTICIVMLSGWAGVSSAQVTAIKAGKLVDPDSGVTLTHQIVLIEGNKITAVGPSVAIPQGATIFDLSSDTVLPGLVDAHTHICFGFRLYGDMDPTKARIHTRSRPP